MKRHLCPRCPSFKRSGIQCLRRPYLALSAVTVSLHYWPRCLRSRVTCNEASNNATWSEHLKICCHVIITR